MLEFTMTNNYDWSLPYLPNHVSSIVEVGSLHALDAIKLSEHFNCAVIAFEPNPAQLEICFTNLQTSRNQLVELRSEALSDKNKFTRFQAIDTSKYTNVGASSFFEIDFSNRGKNDLDRNSAPVQKSIEVEAVRWDSLGLPSPQLLVMDCEGAELLVLQGFGRFLRDVQYIVLEVSPVAIGHGACTFDEVNDFLRDNGFRFVGSSVYGKSYSYLKSRLILSAIRNRVRKPFGKPLRGYTLDVVYRQGKKLLK